MSAKPGRGSGWVAAQFALLAVIVVVLLAGPRWPEGGRLALAAVGALLVVAGAVVAVWAARSLGRALTPFPRPVHGAALVETGPFRVVRHPIYAGGLLFVGGWALLTGPLALALTAVLGVLWAFKARAEEGYLSSHYPGYAGYASRVRRRLIPWVY